VFSAVHATELVGLQAIPVQTFAFLHPQNEFTRFMVIISGPITFLQYQYIPASLVLHAFALKWVRTAKASAVQLPSKFPPSLMAKA